MAKSVIRRRAWAGRFFFLALLLGAATGLFIAFFNVQSWQDHVLRWAFEHEQYALAVHVVERSYGGLSWREWAAVGIAGTSTLLAFWFLLSLLTAWRLRTVPYLRSAVREQQGNWGLLTVLGAIAALPLLIALIGIMVGIGMAASDSGHSHDAGDIKGL
jgi:hypothetical protein